MEYSCLKTLASKHRTKISKLYDEYRTGTKRWGIPYETKSGKKVKQLTKFNEIKKSECIDIIPKEIIIYANTKTTLESRLKAKTCELCGSTDSPKYEIHYINKVKNLEGKEVWEQIMIAKKRKQWLYVINVTRKSIMDFRIILVMEYRWRAVCIERCKHGSERGLHKPVTAM